ncbi:hypothetical protein IX317_001809 [Fusobacterium sp. DD29]|nr:hypothetical protein [Fusobacterium sp. DD29]MBR8762367.1 hypothetical protein [Fusobacterium sp. DD25]MBR8768389.1 hypothetical protein [Fusobacterium sp. DD43]MBR8772479.1 hypothetical protein [Fusobacterium sp. DD40]MBR8776710.1 hypothetical protein [Fusobacterium sp. DD17]MBR8798954.1 hypothetical protein [Fusobacterium sp. DD12]MBR8801127.1 hypothetical protein [Fusobacterium sp. DD10]MBR8805434.1 hypothetical protein [Fusobacterium sp. DD13]MBR8812595.1 hypothetical protein [Fusoba
MIHIYSKEGKFKDSLNYTITEFESSWYDNYQPRDFISETKFDYPVVKNGEIRDMTREEKILTLNQIDLLADGEIVADGIIKKIDCPDDFVQAKWNKELNIWEEGANKESLMLERKNKILEYAQYKKEIEELKEFSDEFESDETIELLESKMKVLKDEINSLLVKIKKIK